MPTPRLDHLTRVSLAVRVTTHLLGLGERRDERGDVPGWVMITVMTVGLVAGLQLFIGPELESMLRSALGKVTN
ncbi:hypothetical protein [Nocardioides daphniae]|uniref:DUF4244 domain-containing protein n=1 Tax=Nocardioides daphniae TaxID=402297 RepID=A0A4P7U993_9ACTN|nr:hypothetical protein [Nocardioides daphniae]QCC76713.1 hypothetical protein E2C04_04820 [Nocardioides daphniae]GGD15581.1 hypothetical protein GCM10007231_13250 [Nocardioides daphniae]